MAAGGAWWRGTRLSARGSGRQARRQRWRANIATAAWRETAAVAENARGERGETNNGGTKLSAKYGWLSGA